MFTKKWTRKDWIAFLVIVLLIVGASFYNVFLFKPKNSLELYQELKFADSFEEAQKLFVDGYEGNFTEEDFKYIQDNLTTYISQFTLLGVSGKSYVIMTTPGTKKLKVIRIEELPDDMRQFFLALSK